MAAKKKPRKRVIPEYDDKPAIDPDALAPIEAISGDQFKGLEEIVEVDSTKYSSDMFDIDKKEE